MKTRMRITLLIIAAITMTFLFSCSLSPVSIEDRIKDFMDSLNGDRSDTYKNLDPSTAAYSTAKPASFWDTPFAELNRPYSYSGLNTSAPSDVTATINDKSVSMGVYHFVMVDVGTVSENWVIKDIQIPPGGAGNTIF
jgi:hypothetical protein